MRSLTRAVGVALLSLTFALGVLEVFVRLSSRFDGLQALLVPESTGQEAAGESGAGGAGDYAQRALIHPYLGWVGRPGAGELSDAGPIPIFEGRKPTAWALAGIRVNLQGFVSSIDDYQQISEEDFAVAILGGSVAEQLVLVAGDSFVEALEARFPALAGRVRILTLASGGFRQPQQLFALSEMVLLGVPIDLVITVDGFNEVNFGGIDASLGHHPLLPSKVHYAMAVDVDALDPSRDRTLLMAQVFQHQQAAAAWLERATSAWWRHSAVARVVAASRVADHRAQARRSEQRFQIALLAGQGSGRLATLDDPCLGTKAGCYELIGDVWARASRVTAAIAAAEGVPYLHALQPNQYVPGGKVLSEEEREFAVHAGPTGGHVEHGYAVLRARGEELRAEGVAFHDLTGIYADHPETLYYDSCCHLNRAGNGILARELVARLDEATVGY